MSLRPWVVLVQWWKSSPLASLLASAYSVTVAICFTFCIWEQSTSRIPAPSSCQLVTRKCWECGTRIDLGGGNTKEQVAGNRPIWNLLPLWLEKAFFFLLANHFSNKTLYLCPRFFNPIKDKSFKYKNPIVDGIWEDMLGLYSCFKQA